MYKNLNPGAIGICWLPSNTGTLRDVTIRSGDGSGVTGVDLTMSWPGPGLGRRLAVEGFDVGIRLQHHEYGMTFNGLALSGQRQAGLRNSGNTVHIRDLHATILQLLGYDHERFSYKYQGLDQRLTGVLPAQPIPELMA